LAENGQVVRAWKRNLGSYIGTNSLFYLYRQIYLLLMRAKWSLIRASYMIMFYFLLSQKYDNQRINICVSKKKNTQWLSISKVVNLRWRDQSLQVINLNEVVKCQSHNWMRVSFKYFYLHEWINIYDNNKFTSAPLTSEVTFSSINTLWQIICSFWFEHLNSLMGVFFQKKFSLFLCPLSPFFLNSKYSIKEAFLTLKLMLVTKSKFDIEISI